MIYFWNDSYAILLVALFQTTPRSNVCNIESIMDYWAYNRSLLEQDEETIATNQHSWQKESGRRRGGPVGREDSSVFLPGINRTPFLRCG